MQHLLWNYLQGKAMQCKTLKKHNYTEIEARWQAVVLINQLTLKMLSEAHLHQWRQNIPSWKKVTDIANAFFPFIWTIRGWRGRGIKVFLQRRVFICNTHSCHSFVVLWIKMKDIIKVSNYVVILAPDGITIWLSFQWEEMLPATL